ncbi:MAG: methylglyoxal synthase [Spirochaetia bacterium]|nr:methylglyoxal synthase [Spirochaetia bacterium]
MKDKIAIIAHDGKKPEMIGFLKDHMNYLTNVEIIATGTTGKYALESGLTVKRKLSGPLGGDAQIAGMVAEKKIKAVIFFRDPLGKHPHEPDVQTLMRVCDVSNTPLATNPSTAHFLLMGIYGEK